MKLLKTISKSKYFILALLVAFSFSCSSEDGADGAVGPAGADGIDGTDGNANVISSGWVEYDTAVWGAISNEFGIDFRNYPIIASEITQDIVDEGVVLVYSRFIITDTQTYMLPFTENITGADPTGQTLSFRFEVNDLTLKMRNVSGTGDPGTFGGSGIAEYRYIIIPSDSGRTESIDFSKMSYEEVITYLGLDL